MNKCNYCGKPLESKRAGAKFCDDKCRKAYGRKDLNRTDNPDKITRTDNPDKITRTDSDAKKKLASQIENIRKMTDERIDALPETSTTKKEGEIKLRGRRASEDYDGTTSPYIDWITDPKECPEDPYKVHCPDFDYESDAAAQQIRINKERSVIMKKK